MKSLINSLFRIILGVIIAIPLLLYPYLYFAQDQLLFIQPKISNQTLKRIKQENPTSYAFALIEAWGGTVYKKIIPNTSHNDITYGRGYWESVKEFLDFI